MAAKDKTTKKRQARGRAKPAAAPLNLELVKALSHELRVEILTILNERVASPNELAKELDEGLSQVSYHVKVLKDYDMIKMVKTVPRRGAVEHYYRATSRPGFSRKDRHMSQATLHLDKRGLRDVGKILDEALKQILGVQSESTARLAGSKGEGLDAMVAMMGIEVPSAGPKKARAKGKKGKAKAKAKAKPQAKGKGRAKAKRG